MKRKVLVLLLAAASLSAQRAAADSGIGFHAIGGSLSYVSPDNLDGTMGFGVFADLGRIAPPVELEPRLDFWSQTQESFGTKASVRDITLGARAKYFFNVSNTKVRPFAGGGLGFHFIRAEATVSAPGFAPMSASQSETKLGLDMGGGIATGLSPKVDLHAELWYGFVSDINQLSLRMGISRKLD
jgi:opacity protein-like surface antigen